MSLTKDKLLAKCQRRYRDVPIGGGEIVRIQSLTEGERAEIETRMFGQDGKVIIGRLPENKLRTLCRCMVDAEGARLFDDGEWQSLRDLDCAVVARIYEACLEHIGFDDDEVAEIVGKSELAAG